ncbi:MAG: signal peptidase I [Lachnospiraceae bacterium]|jgi:hypothetical protein|nr:signal peptidase I [Lachnospiraceae bacterium]
MSSGDLAYTAAAGAIGVGYMVVYLAIIVVSLVGLWKVFTKAGKPGWAAIVPFYNAYCLFEMSFGNGWLFLLAFVPCVNIVVMIMCSLKLAKAFGQGTGFGLGLVFLPFIFMMILGFGDAEYIGVQ